MADPVAVAIKHEATMSALNDTLQSLDERLARIEEATKPADLAPAVLVPGPDIAAIVKAAKEEILAAFVAKAPANSGPVAVAEAEPATKPKGK